MTEVSSNNNDIKEKHGAFVFVLAGLSLIPLLGVLFGVICILIAIIGRKSNSLLLGGIGATGILVTVVLYASLFNKLDDPEIRKGFEFHAKNSLTSLVRYIEFFKLQNERYPKSIDELKSTFNENELVFFDDVSGPFKFGKSRREFYYEVINSGNNYLLFGIGMDDKPFTADDIFPLLDPEKDKAIGWVKSK